MSIIKRFGLAISIFALAGCAANLSPLPPLLQGASSTGGSKFLCQPQPVEWGGSTPETASHSPEIVERLSRDFPPGTSASRLRESLLGQGFTIHEACSPDGRVSWAEFMQRGGHQMWAPAAFGTVHWKEDGAGRLIWTTGDIQFAGI
jgi:hypothetical protein